MNFRTLDLNLLRVFAAVMVERNVTRAALQLAMTQPAVSNALRRLRESVGDELFVTVPGGVAPTPHADAMWPDVREALDRLSEALDPQDFDPLRDERSFAISMADATATVLMPAFAGALAAARARAVVSVLPLTSRDPRLQLERGSADLSVGFFPEVATELASEGQPANIALDPLYRCAYVCVMRRGHPLAGRATLTLDDYCGARHVRVNFAGRRRGFVDEALTAAGRARRIALTVNAFSTAARIVQESELLTVLPRSFVAASGFADGLATRTMPVPLPPIEVGMLWHRRHERDPAQRWLRRTFAAAAVGLGITAEGPDRL